MDFVGGILAFLAASIVSCIGSWLLGKAIRSKRNALVAILFLVKTLVDAGLLAFIFICRHQLPLSYQWLLIGAALGLVLPPFLCMAQFSKGAGKKLSLHSATCHEKEGNTLE